jgi:predicted TIM-barrel fold metal-dependent hydrolase
MEHSLPDDFPKIISVDDHVQEPADVWTGRVPARFGDVAPRVVREWVNDELEAVSRDAHGRWCDVWHYEDVRVPITRYHSSVGFSPDEIEEIPMTFEDMRPGSFDVGARLSDMDIAGVEASLCFPNHFVRFCGQRFLEARDKDLALHCVVAYNDFLHQVWEGTSGGRLIGANIVPMWDPEACADEVRRIADRGARVVCFAELPAWLGLPSLHGGAWDPFVRACADTGMVISMHIGSSSKVLMTSDDAPYAVTVPNLYVNSSLSLADWLISGYFQEFPDLQVSFAEAQAGWIPYLLKRMDFMWEQGNVFLGFDRLDRPPSAYFAEHVTTCVFSDPVGLYEVLDTVGVDRVCFETDYPHPDGSWPDSAAWAYKQMSHLDADVIRRIVRDNAKRLLRL